MGLPEIDEVSMLKKAVFELQAITDLPLQIDTADTKAMEQALRLYNGKAMINSVSGKESSMSQIFPLVKNTAEQLSLLLWTTTVFPRRRKAESPSQKKF